VREKRENEPTSVFKRRRYLGKETTKEGQETSLDMSPVTFLACAAGQKKSAGDRERGKGGGQKKKAKGALVWIYPSLSSKSQSWQLGEKKVTEQEQLNKSGNYLEKGLGNDVNSTQLWGVGYKRINRYRGKVSGGNSNVVLLGNRWKHSYNYEDLQNQLGGFTRKRGDQREKHQKNLTLVYWHQGNDLAQTVLHKRK